MKQKHMHIRIPMYFIGLFIMTTGVALSVKSNLGVSPVSSIPYTITCVWGIEMGKATILFHIVLVILQILLLRKNFKAKSLLQVVVGVIFGYFTTFCNYIASFLPTPDNYPVRIAMLLVSTILVAFGIFLYLPADLIPLAGEGAMSAVSQISGMEFAKVKVRFDCSMVVISMTTCLIALHSLGSVGVGTIAAAILVGTVLGFINKLVGDKRDRLLGKIPDKNTDENVLEYDEKQNYVITISREFGSGGRDIGKLIANQLGFKYYDSELIKLAAEKSGFTTEFVQANEQSLKNPILHDFFEWYATPIDKSELPKVDQLYQKEKEIIRELPEKSSCVIVGRLANHILKDYEKSYHVFISADIDTEIKKTMQHENLQLKEAEHKVKKVNHERTVHCKYFTKTNWGKADNYNLMIRSSDFGYKQTANLIINAFRLKFKSCEF